jgi:bifunctional N-acetylglucosamine-1-phosphate-uridyltransferase/glucosamine-1-phosphate-acetyltransferase GlmU-like protein
MPTTKLALVILAGGLGSRFGGDKQLQPFGATGRFLFEYACYDAKNAGFDKVFVIVRAGMESVVDQQLKKWLAPHRFEVLTQVQTRQKPWGTAHALSFLSGKWSGSFLVLNADDYYGKTIMQQVKDLHELGVSAACLAYALGETLSSFGTVSRGICDLKGNLLSRITEKTKLQSDGVSIKDEFGKTYAHNALISMNAWFLPAKFLDFLVKYVEDHLLQYANDTQSEIYLPNAIQNAIESKVLEVRVVKSQGTWFGLTYPQDLDGAVKHIEHLEDLVYPAYFEQWT